MSSGTLSIALQAHKRVASVAYRRWFRLPAHLEDGPEGAKLANDFDAAFSARVGCELIAEVMPNALFQLPRLAP